MSPVGKSGHKKLPNGSVQVAEDLHAVEHLVDGPHTAHTCRAAVAGGAARCCRRRRAPRRRAASRRSPHRRPSSFCRCALAPIVARCRVPPSAREPASRRPARALLTSITAGGERAHPRVVTLEAYRETVSPPITDRFGVPWTVSDREPPPWHFGHEDVAFWS